MNWQDYAAAVERLKKVDTTREQLALGLCGEAGEVCEVIKKGLRPGCQVDVDRLVEELGDVCWYWVALFGAPKHDVYPVPLDSITTEAFNLARRAGRDAQEAVGLVRHESLSLLLHLVGAIAIRYGFTIEDVLTRNIAKLEARYGGGL